MSVTDCEALLNGIPCHTLESPQDNFTACVDCMELYGRHIVDQIDLDGPKTMVAFPDGVPQDADNEHNLNFGHEEPQDERNSILHPVDYAQSVMFHYTMKNLMESYQDLMNQRTGVQSSFFVDYVKQFVSYHESFLYQPKPQDADNERNLNFGFEEPVDYAQLVLFHDTMKTYMEYQLAYMQSSCLVDHVQQLVAHHIELRDFCLSKINPQQPKLQSSPIANQQQTPVQVAKCPFTESEMRVAPIVAKDSKFLISTHVLNELGQVGISIGLFSTKSTGRGQQTATHKEYTVLIPYGPYIITPRNRYAENGQYAISVLDLFGSDYFKLKEKEKRPYYWVNINNEVYYLYCDLSKAKNKTSKTNTPPCYKYLTVGPGGTVTLILN